MAYNNLHSTTVHAVIRCQSQTETAILKTYKRFVSGKLLIRQSHGTPEDAVSSSEFYLNLRAGICLVNST
jgi:hypothetical protein